MPGKHNAGGCGCCTPSSPCWSCAHPTSLTLSGAGSGCCSDLNGTFVFHDVNTLSNCIDAWTVWHRYTAVRELPPITSGGCSPLCYLTQRDYVVGDGDPDAPFLCKIGSYQGTSGFCRTTWLLFVQVHITAHMRDEVGGSTLTVVVQHLISAETWVPGFGSCIDDQPNTDWTIEDTYESIINCTDATTNLTFVSRTMTNPDGSVTNNPTTISWVGGTYTLCSSPSVTLTK